MPMCGLGRLEYFPIRLPGSTCGPVPTPILTIYDNELCCIFNNLLEKKILHVRKCEMFWLFMEDLN